MDEPFRLSRVGTRSQSAGKAAGGRLYRGLRTLGYPLLRRARSAKKVDAHFASDRALKY